MGFSASRRKGSAVSYSGGMDMERDDNLKSEDRELLPWSHRLGVPGRAVVTLLAGAAVGVVGTLAHRMGASANIPYGLVLAFAVLGLSTWCARSRMGAVGLALHLIASSMVVWQLAAAGPGGDVLTPIGFSVPMPFFSQWAGQIWLWGVIILQVVMLVLPRRWFRMTPRRPQPVQDSVEATDSGETGDIA